MKANMKNLDLLFARRNLLFSIAMPFIGADDDDTSNEENNEGGESDNGGNNTPPPGKDLRDKPKPKVQLSPEQQSYVNSLVAEEKRKGREAANKVITQLETLKNNVGTTEKEKEALAQRIEDLQNAHLTEKEISEKDRKKADKKKDDEIAAAKKDADTWKSRFIGTTVKRSILDAATLPAHKANNPQHIVAILTPDTRLVEEIDEEGKPTGEYVAKSKVKTIKDGKPATLEMTVTEAVKFMSEQDEHAGLFDSGATGGTGSNPNRPNRKGGTADPNIPPTDPNEYRKWREKNRKSLGAGR